MMFHLSTSGEFEWKMSYPLPAEINDSAFQLHTLEQVFSVCQRVAGTHIRLCPQHLLTLLRGFPIESKRPEDCQICLEPATLLLTLVLPGLL